MRIKQRHPYLLLIGLILMSLTACQPAPPTLGNPEQPYPPAHEPVIGDILHLPTGVYVSAQQLQQQAARARVVFVGETHDNPASHRLQLEILQALQQHNPGHISLALEMFKPSQQPILDRWSAGDLSEKEFLKQVGWQRNWNMNFALYRGLLDYSREHRIPLVALNAEDDLKQKLAHAPATELTVAEQKRLPQMDDNDPYHRATVAAFFAAHDGGKAMQEGFRRVQTLWDETMADNLANWLKQQDQQHQVVVIAGGNHIRYGFGIPRRLYRRLPLSYLLIGSEELEIPASKKDRLMQIDKPAYPMPPYDFVVYTAYEDLPNAGVKLGIRIEAAKGGVLIEGVMPGSVAAHNDLQSGDLLTRIDEEPLSEPFDLIYRLQQTAPESRIKLEIVRQGHRETRTINFSESAERP